MINIAIDGPSGAGKSTIARHVSKELGLIYIDTGAMYRALALKAIKLGIDIKREEEKINDMLSNTEIDIKSKGGSQKIFIDGENVTDKIRTPEVSMGASDISAYFCVREYLLSLQRDIAKNNDCIMDGRDIGTCVLPNAQVKIFLTAEPVMRARRRCEEFWENNMDAVYENVLREIKERDKNDSTRKHSPLKKADDAIVVDTTFISLAQSIELIKNIIKDKM